MLFCHRLNLLKINFFQKTLQEYHQSGKQFGTRSGSNPNFLQNLTLIWIQTVCKIYQQSALVEKGLRQVYAKYRTNSTCRFLVVKNKKISKRTLLSGSYKLLDFIIIPFSCDNFPKVSRFRHFLHKHLHCGLLQCNI